MNKQTKTDNTSLEKKIILRKEAIKNLKKVNVLDVFAGENKIWEKIKKDNYYGIEIEKNKGKNTHGDNKKILPVLDLSKYNIIDLDAYGFPMAQINILYKNKTLQKNTIIFYTAIHNERSGVNKELLKHYRLEKMYKQVKTPFNIKGMEMMKGYLYDKGIRKVYKFIIEDKSYTKEYGYFII